MLQPDSLLAQYEGKALAELARGSGAWPVQPHPVDLEPPFDGYHRLVLTEWDCYWNDWEGPWKAGIFGRTRSRIVLPRNSDIAVPESVAPLEAASLVPVTVEQFPEDESNIYKGNQLLRSLTGLRRPVCFEILGLGPRATYDLEKGREILAARASGDLTRDISHAQSGWTEPYIAVYLVAHRHDAPPLADQLQSLYPNSAFVVHEQLDIDYDTPGYEVKDGYAATLRLGTSHCLPLKSIRYFDPDPLGVVVGAFEQLGKHDWGLLQVLFEPARHDWAGVAMEAARDPYKADRWLFDDLDERTLNEKFASPLFAVTVRLLARRRRVFQQLVGWGKQFSQPPQALITCDDDTEDEYPNAVLDRTSYRPGMLLNVDELAGLVHVPSQLLVSQRLRRVKTRTRPARSTASGSGSVVLGDNVHQGKRQVVRISDGLFRRHVYVAGQTGTGKTTLLLNMIVDLINAGEGVGVLDPHGDLIDDVLKRIPKRRVPDVRLFDPTDRDFPPAFNLLSYKDEDERDKLPIETIACLQRLSASPFLSRFEHIMRVSLSTLVQFGNATIADLPRLLLDEAFRARVVGQLRVPELLSFWQQEFPQLPKGATDPILNRLSPLLLNRRIRNIVCQRKTKFDFDGIINRRRIFLGKLSSGLLTDVGTAIIGTLLMSKLLAATFRRAGVLPSQRVPFYLFIDELQSFLQTSIGLDKILSESRKFGLVLTMANQYVQQLTREVRAAIVGNVGSMVCFRLGTADAGLLEDEFGVFSAAEILSLERGQAIARVGGTDSAFNLTTYAPLPAEDEDMTVVIRKRTRRMMARPRAEVERALQGPRKCRPVDTSDKKMQGTEQACESSEAEWSAWDDYVS